MTISLIMNNDVTTNGSIHKENIKIIQNVLNRFIQTLSGRVIPISSIANLNSLRIT